MEEIVRLRSRPDLRRETAELLNAEWPRSLAARYMAAIAFTPPECCYICACVRLFSLEEGEDDLPCSLVLLHKNGQVVGHVRLTAVAGHSGAVLVEACE